MKRVLILAVVLLSGCSPDRDPPAADPQPHGPQTSGTKVLRNPPVNFAPNPPLAGERPPRTEPLAPDPKDKGPF
jgi:hypothetical protein